MRKYAGATVLVCLSQGACSCDGEPPLVRVAPKVEVNPSGFDFGEVPVGATKRARLEVKNAGSADLVLSGVQAAPPVSATLAVDRLRPGEEAPLELAFSPENDAPLAAVLHLLSDDPTRPDLEISVSGRGVASVLSVSPRAIDLSGTPVGTNRGAMLRVTNLGVDERTGRVTTRGFPRPEHFGLSTVEAFGRPTPFALPPRGAGEYVLDYHPLLMGGDDGVLVFEVCGEECGVEVQVQASATQSVVYLEPSSVQFGEVGIGSKASRSVMVVNAGDQPVTLEEVATAGGPELVAVPLRGLPDTLPARGSALISLEYTPASAQPLAGELAVRTNNAGAPIARAVVGGKGVGPLFTVVPAMLHFGVLRQPDTERRSLLMVNAGSGDVRVTALTVSGAAFALAQLPALPARIASGETLVAQISFSPSTRMEHSGQVHISTDDPNRPSIQVPLAGGLADRFCELEASPERLTFGSLPLLYARTLPVTLTNRGPDRCELLSGDFRAPVDPALTLTTTVSPFPRALDPGQSLSLAFKYEPSSIGESKGNFVIRTADTVFPERHVSLSGSSGGYDDIKTIPSAVDFGAVGLGCKARQPVQIVNAGVFGAVLERVAFTASTTPELRFSRRIGGSALPAGATESFELEYEPTDQTIDADAVEIRIVNRPFPLIVPVQGEGSANPVVRDTFRQDRVDQVDVLFVIDDSGSMADDQAGLVANFASFINQANVRQVDFQIGVTRTTLIPEAGLLVGPILTPNTPSLDVQFANQALVGVGGSGHEQGLDAMLGALQLAIRGSAPNGGLLRRTANLLVVLVSDEDDQSNAALSFYTNQLRTLPSRAVLIAAITGQAQGCISPTGGSGTPAPRYEDFVRLNSGVSASICGAWASTLTSIGSLAFGLRTIFTLSRTPDLAQPPTVTVNGNPAPAGSWTYDPAQNAVVFSAPPPEGANVVIEYRPAC